MSFKRSAICLAMAAMAGILLCVVSASAATWDFASSYTTASASNNQWVWGSPAYMPVGFMFPADLPVTVDNGGDWNAPDYNTHSSAPIVRQGITACGPLVYNQTGSNVEMYQGPYGGSAAGHGTLCAGEVAMSISGNPFNPMARWRATVEGDYTYNVTFRAISNAWLGVGVEAGSGDNNNWPGTIASLNSGSLNGSVSTLTFTGSRHLAAGEYFDFYLTPLGEYNAHQWDVYTLNFVAVNATVSDAPVPEPGSMFALASGLVGLVGFGIRRKRA